MAIIDKKMASTTGTSLLLPPTDTNFKLTSRKHRCSAVLRKNPNLIRAFHEALDMATTTASKYPLLDELEREVNRVLWHTANIFKASQPDSKSSPVAHLSQLKHILPGSIDRYHNALDQLEDELVSSILIYLIFSEAYPCSNWPSWSCDGIWRSVARKLGFRLQSE
jgi:hypothetical protein